ncbi:MAG: hypothetical protein GY861_11090 [bacterium]|nr:hypothetical protein [bacterium]
MECPYCGYKHGYFWVESDYLEIRGKKGDFYNLSNEVVAIRHMPWDSPHTKPVNGCPSCGRLFIRVN